MAAQAQRPLAGSAQHAGSASATTPAATSGRSPAVLAGPRAAGSAGTRRRPPTRTRHRPRRNLRAAQVPVTEVARPDPEGVVLDLLHGLETRLAQGSSEAFRRGLQIRREGPGSRAPQPVPHQQTPQAEMLHSRVHPEHVQAPMRFRQQFVASLVPTGHAAPVATHLGTGQLTPPRQNLRCRPPRSDIATSTPNNALFRERLILPS